MSGRPLLGARAACGHQGATGGCPASFPRGPPFALRCRQPRAPPKSSVTGSRGEQETSARRPGHWTTPVAPAPGHPERRPGVFGVAAAATRSLGPDPGPSRRVLSRGGGGASPARLLPGPKASVGEDHGVGGGGPRLLAAPRSVRLWFQQVLGVPQEDHHDRDVVV